jgi:hypothetical protein
LGLARTALRWYLGEGRLNRDLINWLVQELPYAFATTNARLAAAYNARTGADISAVYMAKYVRLVEGRRYRVAHPSRLTVHYVPLMTARNLRDLPLRGRLEFFGGRVHSFCLPPHPVTLPSPIARSWFLECRRGVPPEKALCAFIIPDGNLFAATPPPVFDRVADRYQPRYAAKYGRLTYANGVEQYGLITPALGGSEDVAIAFSISPSNWHRPYALRAFPCPFPEVYRAD